MNRIELDLRDNHTVYLNGVKVEDIRDCSIANRIDIASEVITISFPAEVGIRDERTTKVFKRK